MSSADIKLEPLTPEQQVQFMKEAILQHESKHFTLSAEQRETILNTCMLLTGLPGFQKGDWDPFGAATLCLYEMSGDYYDKTRPIRVKETKMKKYKEEAEDTYLMYGAVNRGNHAVIIDCRHMDVDQRQCLINEFEFRGYKLLVANTNTAIFRKTETKE